MKVAILVRVSSKSDRQDYDRSNNKIEYQLMTYQQKISMVFDIF